MPSRGSGDATAVARTTVSPVVTSAAPDACLAIRPVSKTRRLPPASSTATSCLVDIHCPLFVFRLGNLGWESAEPRRRAGLLWKARGLEGAPLVLTLSEAEGCHAGSNIDKGFRP